MKILAILITTLIPTVTAAANSAPWVGQTLQGLPCTGGAQGYGPFDYTKLEDKQNLPIVEHSHFSADVENHIKGIGGYVPADLDYTLRAFPNHHRALLSVIRYKFKLTNKLLTENRELLSPVECYLQRAIKFSPQDSASYALYGYYLHKIGHLTESSTIYQKALEIDNDNPKIAYSLSLLLIDMKEYERALKYAKIAYKNKKTPESLKLKLKNIGIWTE
ncbi:hypothetical protein NP590_03185 [Methylomonas sp. SURF-2]|uniref:TPR repeat-containing protein n=1 Tax=Methylomonas subterranea TaxID=2952225 RepID=A0ABT1TCC5_9GAMM|nr:hypothetical protein [Methylomonas sp. SURF-2]MCQ8103101.1 hypothetical protein [Methylomonas sp. SURF-2]